MEVYTKVVTVYHAKESEAMNVQTIDRYHKTVDRYLKVIDEIESSQLAGTDAR